MNKKYTDMKHLKLLWTAIVFGVLPFSFTSCDDPWDWDYYDYYGDWYYDYNWYDDAFDYGTDELRLVANTLRGHWEGTMRNEYTDNTGHRVYVDMYVYFEFDQYNSRSLNGRGREIDTVGDESQELRFSWYIDPRSGDIHIRYDDSGYTFVLDSRGSSQTSGFSLTDDYFNGVMEGVNNDELIFFDCVRTTLAKPSQPWTTQRKAASATDSAKLKYTENLKFRSRK